MARFKKPSAAVLRARARRAGQAEARNVRMEWFANEVAGKVELTMEQRVRLATAHVMTKVVRNISRPVTVGRGPRGGRVVKNRSKPGQFPKADTTQLMKSIFSGVYNEGKQTIGYVGTPLDYGLILETRMNRSFLKRTLDEERSRVIKLLTGPIR